MKGSRWVTVIASLVLASAALGWTPAGRTSGAQLDVRDLPFEADGAHYRSQWVGGTPAGELFLVTRTDCARPTCSSWLMEKAASKAHVLLELDGSLRLQRVTGTYPVVEQRTRADDVSVLLMRYEWNGHQYARTFAQQVYQVNGFECGTRDECRTAAERALAARKVDRAVRIWQKVYGVSWI
jgi:hypothetical protein